MTAWTAWTADELTRIGDADEVQIAFRRRDGSLSTPRIVWVVRDGDALYVRSVNGRDSAWFRGVQARHEGHLRGGGVEHDIAFVEAEPDAGALDAAYRTKYGRYPGPVAHITAAGARAATLAVEPR